MRKWGTPLLAGVAIAASLLLLQERLHAQGRTNTFNGVGYTFPSTQGEAGNTLINDGAGNLTWANPPTVAELWSGAILFSTIACPSGFTRATAADGLYFKGAATGGGVGGSSIHSHTIIGVTGSTGVSLSGDSGAQTVSLGGSTGSTSIGHTHSTSSGTTACQSGSSTVLSSCSVNSGDASHSHSVSIGGGSHVHGVGTLAGSNHTHDQGTLAAGTTTIQPPYYGVVVCVKD